MTHRMHQVAGSNGFVKASAIALTSSIALVTSTAQAADQALLDILLSNGAIDQAQYDELLSKEALEEADVVNIGFANGSGRAPINKRIIIGNQKINITILI